MKSDLSVRTLMACFVVVAGRISLFNNKDIALMCIGGALGFLAPKPPTGATQ